MGAARARDRTGGGRLTATRARNRQVETEEGKEDALGRGRRVRTAKLETGDDGRKRELDARGVVDAETGEFGGERAGVEERTGRRRFRR